PPPAPYHLSLHDALPIFSIPLLSPIRFCQFQTLLTHVRVASGFLKKAQLLLFKSHIAGIERNNLIIHNGGVSVFAGMPQYADNLDRKSTRLNSSHVKISY